MAALRNYLLHLQNWVEGIAPYLNDLVVFFLILFLGFIIAKLLSRLSHLLLKEIGAGIRFGTINIARAVASMVAIVVYIITIIIAINTIGVTTIVFQIVVVLFLLLILLSIVLALKDIVPNFIGGLVQRGNLIKNTTIKMNGVTGKIVEKGLLQTTVALQNGDHIVIPNALFQKEKLIIRGGKK